MTDSTAEAVNLLPCPQGEIPADRWNELSAAIVEAAKTWKDTSADRAAMMLFSHRDSVIRFIWPIIQRWNTRPQPAPPEGEPDFFSSLNELQRETIAKLRKTLEWSHHTDVIVRKDGQDHHFEADWLRVALDRLCQASRLRVEDAEVAEALLKLRNLTTERGYPDCEPLREAADLLERLAGELAEREAALAKAVRDRNEREAILREADFAVHELLEIYQPSQITTIMDEANLRHAARQQQKP